MSSGALIVITIPNEKEEQLSREKYASSERRSSSKNLPSSSKITPFTIKPKSKEKLRFFPSKFPESQYGTFSPCKSYYSLKKTSIDNETVIAIDDASSECSSKGQKDEDLSCDESPRSMQKFEDHMKTFLIPNRRRDRNIRKLLSDEDLDICETSYMETVIKKMLNKYKIENFSWNTTNNGESFQVIFTMEYDENYEKFINKLNEWGIGEREGSSVSILNCSIFRSSRKNNQNENDNPDTQILKEKKNSPWGRFMNAMNARLNVAQIVKDVRQEAAITFDFVVLVVSAAILASFGLTENSTIFLASSMLVSPLMGPIIAAIFGFVIKDRSLQALGIRNEICGITIATGVGFIFGLVICLIDQRFINGEALSEEMLSRCTIRSLILGILVAIPSGAAAAIGILGGNIGSLVGVAISASILPPAVNTGIIWAFGCIYFIFANDETRYKAMTKTSYYSQNQGTEMLCLGGMSMSITITNVICIYILGILVLKVKEIAPIVSNRQFWKHDIKIAREINKNAEHPSTVEDDNNSLPDIDRDVFSLNPKLMKTINLDKYSNQHTWSPMSANDFARYVEKRPNIQEFERMYMNLSRASFNKERKSSKSNIIPCVRSSASGASRKLSSIPEFQVDISERSSASPAVPSSPESLVQKSSERQHKWKSTESGQEKSSGMNPSNIGGEAESLTQLELVSSQSEKEKQFFVKNIEIRGSRKFIVTPAIIDDFPPKSFEK